MQRILMQINTAYLPRRSFHHHGQKLQNINFQQTKQIPDFKITIKRPTLKSKNYDNNRNSKTQSTINISLIKRKNYFLN